MIDQFLKIADEFVMNYDLSADEKKKVEKILGYFFGEKPSKGLILLGGTGTGKSIIFKVIQRMLPPSKKFAMSLSGNIVAEFREYGDKGLKKYFEKNRCIDDIGDEESAKHYGNDVSVIDFVIKNRYEVFQKTSQRTFMISNLSWDEMTQKYDPRTTDRITEMCDLIEFGGSSKRLHGKIRPQENKALKTAKTTVEEKREIRRDYLNKCFFRQYDEYFMAKDYTFNDPSRMFRVLKSLLMIKLTKEQYDNYMLLAVESLKKDAVPQDKTARNQYRDMLAKLAAGKVISRQIERARKLAFIDWLKEMRKTKNNVGTMRIAIEMQINQWTPK